MIEAFQAGEIKKNRKRHKINCKRLIMQAHERVIIINQNAIYIRVGMFKQAYEIGGRNRRTVNRRWSKYS